jgi:hypothetical protein
MAADYKKKTRPSLFFVYKISTKNSMQKNDTFLHRMYCATRIELNKHFLWKLALGVGRRQPTKPYDRVLPENLEMRLTSSQAAIANSLV